MRVRRSGPVVPGGLCGVACVFPLAIAFASLAATPGPPDRATAQTMSDPGDVQSPRERQPLIHSSAPPLARSYVCYWSPGPITVDGLLDDTAWQSAPWSESFVDILGDTMPAPPLRTRLKLLWDSTYLYVAAELEEPHAWATLTEHDATIFHDDDFEAFIDPDGDGLNYYEIEINALGTVWDLLLVRPYREGGPAITAWDIRGLKSAVRVEGTLNDPSDTDRGWTVEMALPWTVLAEAARSRHLPQDGEEWRMNFSRVEWDVAVENGAYRKVRDPATGGAKREHNWTWAPQGAVNMHLPERWGTVRFSSDTPPERTERP